MSGPGDEAPPRTARDLLKARALEVALFDAVIGLAHRTGWWRFPAPTNGDLEHMTLLDKIYWLYKAMYPVERAVRGSRLEAFFAEQRRHAWRLPAMEVAHEITVSSAGDLMDHLWLRRSAGALYDEVADLVLGADLAMANLECPVSARAEKPLAIDPRSAPPLHLDLESFDAVVGAGDRRFGFLATACNHSLDLGADGVDFTLRALRDRGIASHGTNATEEGARTATLLDRSGIRLAVVAFTFGLNAHRPPPTRPSIVNRMNLNALPSDADFGALDRMLAHARAEAADYVVAHLHWGLEHETYPRPAQIEMAHELAERGVDAIVGHHPHVVQPMECYRTRRDPLRVVPIFYSLGNLVNPFSAPLQCRSAVARVDLAKGRLADGSWRTYARDARMHTVEQVLDPAGRKIRLRLVP